MQPVQHIRIRVAYFLYHLDKKKCFFAPKMEFPICADKSYDMYGWKKLIFGIISRLKSQRFDSKSRQKV